MQLHGDQAAVTSDLGCSLPTSHLTPTSQFTSMGHREPKAGWPSGAPPPHSGPILRKASLSPALALLASGWALTTSLPSPQTQHLSAAPECPLTLPAAQAEGRPQTSGPLLRPQPWTPSLLCPPDANTAPTTAALCPVWLSRGPAISWAKPSPSQGQERPPPSPPLQVRPSHGGPPVHLRARAQP